jgi:hypothetical protein
MKKSKLLLVLLSFIGLTVFGQQETKTINGTIKAPRAFNDQCGLKVDDTFLVLIKDHKDVSGKSFEINAEYKDLIIEKDGKYEIAPKYADKKFKVTYYVNGKGWKCISKIEVVE